MAATSIVGVGLAVAVLVGGCNGDGEGSTTEPTTTTVAPTTVAPTTTASPTTTIDPLAAEEAAVSEAAEQARLARLSAHQPRRSERARRARSVLRAGQPGSRRRLTSRCRTSVTRAGGSERIRRFRKSSTSSRSPSFDAATDTRPN